MLETLLFSGLFLVLHVQGLRRWPERPFHLQLAVSRGWAALCLVALGLGTLIGARRLWRLAFVDFRPPGDPAFLIVFFILGHLIADFIWLAYGWRVRQSRPRADLLAHHLLGVVACGLALWLHCAPLLVGVVLITELMPVVSGLHAWARLGRNIALQRLAARLRLLTLVGLRIPVWAFFLWRAIPLALGDRGGVEVVAIYPLVIAAVLCVLALDLRWTRMSWRALVTAES